MAHDPNDLHFLKTGGPFVIILDDLDFTFFPHDLDQAVELWEAGTPLPEMAAALRPCGTPGKALDEIRLLLMHLRRRGRIRER
ncbi:MAG: hypothetical protein SCK57_13095 [Bacillota bacterium]|nr:hypothetical protein [Bacillota bacterium]